jgi:hypothetical protein
MIQSRSGASQFEAYAKYSILSTLIEQSWSNRCDIRVATRRHNLRESVLHGYAGFSHGTERAAVDSLIKGFFGFQNPTVTLEYAFH